jgi:hypothetical protein
MGRMESSKAGRVIIVKNTQRLFQEFLDRLKKDAGHLFLHVLLRSILIQAEIDLLKDEGNGDE